MSNVINLQEYREKRQLVKLDEELGRSLIKRKIGTIRELKQNFIEQVLHLCVAH